MIELMFVVFLAAAADPPSAAPPSAQGSKIVLVDPAINRQVFVTPGPGKPATGASVVGPETAPSIPRPPLSLSYWIQQVDDYGQVQSRVGVGHRFRHGDRIQLVVESDGVGYLALVQEGADGQIGLLYPEAERDLGKAAIAAHSRILLPGPRYSFTFDDKSGEIRLLLILASTREELAALPLRNEMTRVELQALRDFAARDGGKNLFVQAFAEKPEEPVTQTVNRAGGTIIQELKLSQAQ